MKRLLLPFVSPAFLVSLLFAFSIIRANSVQAQTHFVAFLEGTEEDATFMVPAHGYAHVILSKDHSEIRYFVNVWKKTEPGNPTAHFHTGPRRVNGPVVKHLDLQGGLIATGVWKMTDDEDPLTADLVDSLLQGKMYVNAHTLNNPGGELRGQLFEPEAYYAFANAREEVPDPGKDTLFGGGAGIFVRDPINNTVYYRVTSQRLSSAVTMAHIHAGAFGQAGPPVKNTTVDTSTNTTSGYWTPESGEQSFSSEQLLALRSGLLYWNIHTGLHGAGELRGQIKKPKGYLFTTLLSGPTEEIGSGAEGTGFLYLTPNRDTLITVVAAAGLSGPITDGHIHVGQPAVDGPPVVSTPRTPFGLLHIWTASDEERPLTPADVDSLFAGAYYVNLHTTKYPAGEIRGQIIPLSQEPAQAHVESSFDHDGVLGLAASNNPVSDNTTIKYDLPYPMSVELTLVDMTGKKVWRNVQSGVKGLNHCTLNVHELSAGSYVMQLSGGGESATMNLVIAK